MNALGHATVYARRDGEGRLTRKVKWTYSPNGHTVEEAWGAGQSIQMSNRQGTLTDRRRDAEGVWRTRRTVRLDAEGRKKFEWNGGGDRRLRQVKGKGNATLGEYLHDHRGLRLLKRVGGVETHYVYDDEGRLWAELRSDGTVAREYIWLGMIPVQTTVHDARGRVTAAYAVHVDHLGTPRLLTDASGRAVWLWDSGAFGGGLPEEDPDGDGTAVTFNLRYPGQYYDAKTGRYLTPDPIGLAGGLARYVYANGNPVMNTDWTGLVFGVPAGEFHGENAALYWAEKQVTTGNAFHAIPGLFASLWTPKTSNATAMVGLTVTSCYAARLFGPFSTEGLSKYPQRLRTIIRYDRSHHGKPRGFDGAIPDLIKRIFGQK